MGKVRGFLVRVAERRPLWKRAVTRVNTVRAFAEAVVYLYRAGSNCISF